jgi:hypothetical protein
MHRRKILVAASASLDHDQGTQLQLWDWSSPCELYSIQTTARLHCVSVSPLDTSMKGLASDARCICLFSSLFVNMCLASLRTRCQTFSFSVWHFALDADDYGSYAGGQGAS